MISVNFDFNMKLAYLCDLPGTCASGTPRRYKPCFLSAVFLELIRLRPCRVSGEGRFVTHMKAMPGSHERIKLLECRINSVGDRLFPNYPFNFT